MRQVSSHFLNPSMVGAQGFGVDQAEQERVEQEQERMERAKREQVEQEQGQME